jgi:hypothetical protein
LLSYDAIDASFAALRLPLSKRVCDNVGPREKNLAGQVNQLAIDVASNPADALNKSDG